MPLTPLEFERAMRLAADVRVAELELAAIVARAQRRLEEANRRVAEHTAALAKRYRRVMPSKDANYRLDERTQALVPVGMESAPG